MSLKGNIGEWSEIYTFLKILVDRVLDTADENLKKTSLFYPVQAVYRTETGKEKTYELIPETESVRILEEANELGVIDCSDLKNSVAKIFSEIRSAGGRSYAVPSADDFMTRLLITKLNAGNTKKEDLVLRVYDMHTRQDAKRGFSIKSQIGSAATLLNASSATNFIYEVSGLKEEDVLRVGSMGKAVKVRDRLGEIEKSGGTLSFVGVSSTTFESNLRKIESILPEILAEILVCYYRGKGSNINELVNCAFLTNPDVKGIRLTESDFQFKIMSLLHNVALGMVPGKLWSGKLTAHGGFIIVREDGEIVCYDVHNADDFRTYLFNNTRLETASTTRHGFAGLYTEDGKVYIKLNLQIRFLK